MNLGLDANRMNSASWQKKLNSGEQEAVAAILGYKTNLYIVKELSMQTITYP
jgi:hypothetical protein